MDYQEKTTSGEIKSWQRSHSVSIINKLGTTPMIMFNEEVATILPDESISTKEVGNVSDSMTDPAKTFNLINPIDGAVIGEMTYQELYVALSSLYLNLALERDAQQL